MGLFCCLGLDIDLLRELLVLCFQREELLLQLLVVLVDRLLLVDLVLNHVVTLDHLLELGEEALMLLLNSVYLLINDIEPPK